MQTDTFNHQTLLGFDFGLKHIGVAIGQTLTCTAQPLTSLKAENGFPRWEEITKLITDWQPDAFVVGMPLNMDGSEQPLTHATRIFTNELETRFHLTVHLVDERLTSVEARAHLFAKGGYKALQKKAIDSMAAKLILENWLTNSSF